MPVNGVVDINSPLGESASDLIIIIYYMVRGIMPANGVVDIILRSFPSENLPVI